MGLALLTGCAQSLPPEELVISNVAAVTLSENALDSNLRVIALANGAAEIISALGMKSVLVGRDIASTEADLIDIPIVSAGHQIIPEKIISLKPDLVLIDAASGPLSAITTLKKFGINVISIRESWTLGDIAGKIQDIAIALEVPERGIDLTKRIEAKIIASPAPEIKDVKVAFLYLRGTSSIYLIGGPGSGADALIGAAGAIDIGAARLGEPFNSMTSEVLAASDPDVLLVMTKGIESVGGIDSLIELPGIAQTSAGKSRRVITVDDSLLLSFGPRTPSLVIELRKAIVAVMTP
jgi:iron complex transport system substrate-binding protein